MTFSSGTHKYYSSDISNSLDVTTSVWAELNWAVQWARAHAYANTALLNGVNCVVFDKYKTEKIMMRASELMPTSL